MQEHNPYEAPEHDEDCDGNDADGWCICVQREEDAWDRAVNNAIERELDK